MNKLIKQAFTLIELLVVIAIIGILSGLIVVAMSGVTQKANIAKGQVFSNSLKNALMLNLVSEWKLDNGTVGNIAGINDILDTWGVNNAISVNSGPIIKGGNDCISGNCLIFDGIDDYVDLGSRSSLQITGAISFSFWFKASTPLNTWTSIISLKVDANNYYTINYRNTTFILNCERVAQGTSTPAYSSSVPVDQWTHAVAVWDLSLWKIYINAGTPSTSGSATVAPTGTFTFTIGNNSSYAPFKGFIDDVRIYNAAMPTYQIKEQYYAGLNKLLASGNISITDYQSRLLIISKK